MTFFIVLSGFVLRWSARPGLPASTFWWRRFARICPALVAGLLDVVVERPAEGRLRDGWDERRSGVAPTAV